MLAFRPSDIPFADLIGVRVDVEATGGQSAASLVTHAWPHRPTSLNT